MSSFYGVFPIVVFVFSVSLKNVSLFLSDPVVVFLKCISFSHISSSFVHLVGYVPLGTLSMFAVIFSTFLLYIGFFFNRILTCPFIYSHTLSNGPCSVAEL